MGLFLLFFFFFSSPRVSKEIQSVSQQIQSCLANPVGTSASMKLLQKSLGRPLPFKVLVLCLQKICISSNIYVCFKIITKICSFRFPGLQNTFLLDLLD